MVLRVVVIRIEPWMSTVTFPWASWERISVISAFSSASSSFSKTSDMCIRYVISVISDLEKSVSFSGSAIVSIWFIYIVGVEDRIWAGVFESEHTSHRCSKVSKWHCSKFKKLYLLMVGNHMIKSVRISGLIISGLWYRYYVSLQYRLISKNGCRSLWYCLLQNSTADAWSWRP